jgi:short-subunit dehydrogenase involved in D-alanine esterification of teichoic acids
LCHYVGLWGVVNNAGGAILADLDMTTENIMRRVMDVNLFGMVRVTKTFLPLVKKTRGRVVNMSSLSGKHCMVCDTVGICILVANNRDTISTGTAINKFGQMVALSC